MSTAQKFCRECGLQLDLGLAQCPRCGTRVGTLFSDTKPPASPRSKYREHVAKTTSAFHDIERARERANNALILALASFFCPALGMIVGAVALLLGANALRTLKAHFVEEGRGPAWAAIVIGAIGLVANFFTAIYLVKQGLPLTP